MLLCLAAPKAFGVVPAPDGGYPGGNTAEGQSALLSLTTAGFNTAVGYLSLRSITTGFGLNTGVGAGTLLANTVGEENTAIGAGALLSNTDGYQNTATGAFALFSNTGGGLGIQNTADGDRALFSNTTGGANTATGFQTLGSNIDGNLNTAHGGLALFNNTHGNGNTAVGFHAGLNITGSENIALGHTAGSGVTTASSVICIGATGEDVSNSCYIGNIFGATSSNGVGVLVNSNGRLGTMTSSARFKDEIKRMDNASEALFALKPVTFRYKKAIDPAGTSQLGLVAEDVDKVNPDLVVRDKEGKPYSVRYDQVNAMLLNEFLKEHTAFLAGQRKVQDQDRKIQEQERKIQKQETTIAQVRKEMEAVVARLKEHDSKIQRVSDQIEMRKAAAQTVVNSQ